MSNDTKPFPIQGEIGWEYYQDRKKPSSIPWWLAEIAHKHYVQLYGNCQSLERLAERGGFGREELISLLRK